MVTNSIPQSGQYVISVQPFDLISDEIRKVAVLVSKLSNKTKYVVKGGVFHQGKKHLCLFPITAHNS